MPNSFSSRTMVQYTFLNSPINRTLESRRHDILTAAAAALVVVAGIVVAHFHEFRSLSAWAERV